MSDLLSLAARVEALGGPDREVDVAVFRTIGAPAPFQFAGKMVALVYSEDEHCYFAPVGDMRVRYQPPAYTASLDAAMTLYVCAPDRVPADPRKVAAEALRQRAETTNG